MKTDTERKQEIRQYAIDRLEDLKGSEVYGCDLHHEIFNTDYYIIGRYDAKQWLGDDVFEAIDVIKEYEQDNFGEVNTDLSEPERVVNMYVYILGEEVLQESETLRDIWDNYMTDDNIGSIIKELKEVK